MIKNLVLYGGSFDPPGLHHERIAEELSRRFDHAIVVPCGNNRIGKTMGATVQQRRMLCARAFQQSYAGLDDYDLENGVFTPTVDLHARYTSLARTVWHVIGSDLSYGGAKGESEIQQRWKQGAVIWNEVPFVVVERPGFPIRVEDLPLRNRILNGIKMDNGSSSEIRRLIQAGERFDHLVSPSVAEYIRYHRLYTNP